MMLKVFPDDDLGSTAHDHKKEQEKGIHMTPTAMMSSISMLALPERGIVFVLGADTSRVGIDVTLILRGRNPYNIPKVDPSQGSKSIELLLRFLSAILFWDAFTFHFHDLNAETIRCTTMRNVLANLEQARDKQSHQPESPFTPSRQPSTSDVHFYAGNWEELCTILSVVRMDANLSFSEDDYMDGCSSHVGSIIAHETCLRQSTKLSGSRAWERASDGEPGVGGYDVILITEIPHSMNSLRKLYDLISKAHTPYLREAFDRGTKSIQLAEAKMGSEGLSTGQEDVEAGTLEEYVTELSFELCDPRVGGGIEGELSKSEHNRRWQRPYDVLAEATRGEILEDKAKLTFADGHTRMLHDPRRRVFLASTWSQKLWIGRYGNSISSECSLDDIDKDIVLRRKDPLFGTACHPRFQGGEDVKRTPDGIVRAAAAGSDTDSPPPRDLFLSPPHKDPLSPYGRPMTRPHEASCALLSASLT
ncbi:hypothetical protein BHM03_00048120 [Ensete ventricosum]|nr:hypothetical protein BHM03_00048120 [Ensete ventricosum]